MAPPPDIPDTVLDRLDVLAQQTRQKILEGVEQMVQRQVEATLAQTRQMLRDTADAVVRANVELVAAEARRTANAIAEDLARHHAGPLLAQFRAALEKGLEDVIQRQMQPVLERARQGVAESADLARQFADAMVARLKETVAQPAVAALREQAPEMARRAGRAATDYLLAATMFCLAAIFLLVGSVLGLQEAGVAPFATYCLGGLAALAAGLVFLWLNSRPAAGAGKDAADKAGS